MSWTIIAGLTGSVAIVAIIIVGIVTRNSNDDSPMPVLQRWVLVTYLLVLGAFLVYFLSVLGAVDFPETTFTVGGGNAAQVSSTTEAPLLKRVFPELKPGSTPDVTLTLYGQYFKDGATVSVNSKERGAKTIEAGTLIEAPLLQTDLSGAGSLTVEVINPDKKISNAVTLPVTRSAAAIEILGWHRTATRELQLLLLVLFAGALGSYIHAIRSLTDFIGNRSVVASWFWWYIARPFVGMSMALIFYAVLRGGFLAGTPADAKVVNPFGVIAIGALVGMFSDKAAQKLAEVFDTLFKASDTRKDKLTSLAVDKIQPDHARPATAPPPEITISGRHLSGVEKVRVNQQDRIPKSADDNQVKLSLTAADVAQVAEIAIALVDKAGTVTAAGTFFVTDLDITPPANLPAADTLLPATHGQPYTQTFSATGGTAPYHWELVDPVSGLQIGAANGQLTGAISSTGDFAVNVKVTDSKKASVSKSFKLKVN